MSLVDDFVYAIPIWIQAYGLPLKFYNKDIAISLGNNMGKIICFDDKSPFNDYGMRFRVYLFLFGLKNF